MQLVKRGFVVCDSCGADVPRAVLFVRAAGDSDIPIHTAYCPACANDIILSAIPAEPEVYRGG